jgi:hypothetical protein
MAHETTALQRVLQEAHYVDATNDHPGQYGDPLILNKVFDLLVLMVNVLQKTAAAQANRLNFLTAYQQAYTAEMNQIHSFVAQNGDDSAFGGTTKLDDASNTFVAQQRDGLNSLNTTFTQEMQGNNGVISNDAKALQSVVNQTNDEVQSQTDMATSVLQTLSTILTSINQAAT